MTVTAAKRETGVSGAFLKLNLKGLEYSLGTEGCQELFEAALGDR